MAFKLCFKITFVQKKHCWLQSAQFVTVKCHNVWHSCSHLLHQSDVLSECIQWGVAISITCTTNQCSLVKTIKNKTLTTTHHSAVTGAYISFNIAYDDDNEGSSAQIVQNSLWRCSQQIFCCKSCQYLEWLACKSTFHLYPALRALLVVLTFQNL